MPIIPKSENLYDEPDDQQTRLEGGGEEGGNKAGGMLPKSILMGKDVNVGDKVILEVTGIYDDQIQVAYPEEGKATSLEDEETAETPMEGEPAPAEEPAEAPGEPLYD